MSILVLKLIPNNYQIILLLICGATFSWKIISCSSTTTTAAAAANVATSGGGGGEGKEFVKFSSKKIDDSSSSLSSSSKNLAETLLSALAGGFGVKNFSRRVVEDGKPNKVANQQQHVKQDDQDDQDDQVDTNDEDDQQWEAEDDQDQDEDESWEAEDDEGGDEEVSSSSGKKSDQVQDQEDQNEAEEDEGEDEFRREDLIDDVTELERDAQVEEQSSLLPQILGLFNNNNDGHNQNFESFYSTHDHGQSTVATTISEDKINETITLPEDLSELPEDIVDDIAAGVEESLLLSDDSSTSKIPSSSSQNATETRQFSIYMFQGQYMPEARLNRFVDGAIRNMGGELRMAVMDPLYFRVLPRGRVESRQKPIGKLQRTGAIQAVESLRGKQANDNDNHSIGSGEVEGRTGRAGFLDRLKKIGGQQQQQQKRVIIKKKPNGRKRAGGVGALTGTRRRIKNRRRRRKPVLIKNGVRRRRPNNNNKNKNKRNPNRKKNQNQNRRRKFFRRKKKKPQGNRRRPGGGNQKNKNKNKKNNNKGKFQQNKNRRQKRRVRRNVGGGRVEGLSVINRDGDAEMQVFGNYTLIRSHMKMGPVQLQMQFRTRRGLRRTGATLPVIRMHTVTRVNMEGSEMIDFLLDRPHPESIKVRGKLFPLAQRIARNIFARLFVPNSFLVSRLREKASLALLSKPKSKK